MPIPESLADTCQAGVCVGGNPVVCAASDQCHVAGAGDPAAGVCSNLEEPDGTACDADDNACTVGDAGQGGTSVARPAVVCHAPGTCDLAIGVCSAPTMTVGNCESGRIKDGPGDCDGACCAAGDNRAGEPGERRCQPH